MSVADPSLAENTNVSIQGSAGLPILLDMFYLRSGTPKPIVIFSHGFKGFKDWGHFNSMARLFARRGLAFVKFNFSHNGTTAARPGEFADLEAFGRNNYIIELDDLKTVIDWVEHQTHLKDELDTRQIFLLGHSRGGGISILKAREDIRIKKLCTWASVSGFVNRNKKKTVDTWLKEGVVYTTNTRTNQEMPLYRQFYDILISNKKRLNVLAAARKLRIPFLIIHGDGDEAVPVREAESLHASARHSELLIIEGAGHTFGARHPHTSGALPQHAEAVVEETVRFFLA